MRIFRFDPFAQRAKEQSTVGALPARHGDVDVVTTQPAAEAFQHEHQTRFIDTTSKVLQND